MHDDIIVTAVMSSCALAPGQLTYVPDDRSLVLGEGESGGGRHRHDVLHSFYWTSVTVQQNSHYSHTLVLSTVLQWNCGESYACLEHAHNFCQIAVYA